MRGVSLFSGVGGFECGFERAGIETVLQAERDPWCLEVLARHWPETERVTDVRDVGLRLDTERCGSPRRDVPDAPHRERAGDSIGASGVDLVYGGFPCQDLSVAGKRAGLGGERSGEWFEFHRVLRELRPRWAVVENVPGLLSSNEGRDFAVILDGLDELGFDVAWAVLDAQHFGVPQRRRRVFVVAGPTRRGVEQVLSLCESCGGNPETGRAAGEGTTGALSAGTLRAGGVNGGNNPAGGYLADVAKSLRAQGNDSHREDTSTYVVASTLRGRSHGAGVNMPGRGGEEAYGDNLITPALAVRTAQTGSNGWGVGTDEQAYTLDGAQGQAIVGALSDGAHHGGGLNGQDAYTGRIFPADAGVRRLTPLECERLQGFPDGWTEYTSDGRAIADSHRYRMMGNAVAVPCAEWIGHRLVAVDRAAAPPVGEGRRRD